MQLPFFEIELINALLILLVPLNLEFSRVIVKGVFLLYQTIFEKKPKPRDEVMPKVSIIVPAHNEGAVIDLSLIHI